MKYLLRKFMRFFYDPEKHHDLTVVFTSLGKPARVFHFVGQKYRLYIFSVTLVTIYILIATGALVWLTLHYLETASIFKENEELMDIKNKYYEKLEDEKRAEQTSRLTDLELQDLKSLPTATRVQLVNMLPSGQPFEQPQRLTSGFGYRIHPIFHIRKIHEGQDFGVPVGTQVLATAQGVVSYVGEKSGYGTVLEITHPYGFKTLYAHLSSTRVKLHQFIYKGQPIAASGNSGRSSGPHLHYEVQFFDRPLNPEHFINWSVKNIDYLFKEEHEVEWESFLKILSYTQAQDTASP